jgi:hypothetical protein
VWGTFEFGRHIRNRVSGARSVVSGAGWELRLARPQDLFEYLSARPRTTAEVASLLGCSDPEAGALLWGLGFAHDGRVWTSAGDEAARVLSDSIQQIRTLGRSPSLQELPQLANEEEDEA